MWEVFDGEPSADHCYTLMKLAAVGGREGLVGVRCPHVEQFDVAVAPAVLAEGVLDVGGLADLAVHDFEPRVFEVRNPNRTDHFSHGQVLRE